MGKAFYFNIIFLIISNCVSAQTVYNLDVKNGFRHFKLGSSPSQINNITKEQNQSSRNSRVVAYEYHGSDINTVFNVKVDKVTLSFFDSKLFNISVSFGSISRDEDFKLHEFNSILSTLELTYGTTWFEPTNEDGIFLNGSIWDGKNVCLELLRIDFSKSRTNPKYFGIIGGYLNVYDKKLTNQMYSSEY